MFRVTVVIVTFQSEKTIGSALDALKEAHDNGIAEVVVVDNVSTDSTTAIIEKDYPWVLLVRNTENIGFGRGCNCGSQYAKAPYLMFLNPDAKIQIQSLTRLLDFMEAKPSAGMCGPVLKGTSGEVRSVPAVPTPLKIIVNPLLGKWISRKQLFVQPGDEPVRTEWIRGACMVVRRDVFDNIGGFDPRFFLYFEETDLSIRIQKTGKDVWIVGDSTCEHVNAASAKQTKAPLIFGDTIAEHYFKSRFYYMVKHFGWILAISAETGEILSMTIRAVLDSVRGKRNKELGLRLQSPVLKRPVRVHEHKAMN